MQFLAAYIMKGRMQALMVTSSLALLSLLFPQLSIVSSAVIALVTLRLGAKEGSYILLGSALATAVLSMLIIGNFQFALVRALMVWLPVWIIAIVLRETKQLALTLEIAILLAIVFVLGFYLFQPDPALIWREMLEIMIKSLTQAQPDIPVAALNTSANNFAHFMTGAAAVGSVTGLILGLFLARWWQANLYNPGGFRDEYMALRGHSFLAVITLLILAIALLMSSELCWNILIVLALFYTFIGTAVTHSLITYSKHSRYLLPVFYLILFIIPQFMLMVAICGLGDTWLDLRNKLKPKGA